MTKITSSSTEGLHQASQLGGYASSKLAQRQDNLLSNSSQNYRSSDTLESAFKQHPDLFRDTSQQAQWNESNTAVSSRSIRTLLIREHQTAPLLREYLLSDSRLSVCATAERLGDACRQIRKQNYSVIVLAIGKHMPDTLALLDLMNASNPQARAVAVLEPQAIEQLKSMMHPKVLGYVAASDANRDLADSIVEVFNGRFTASPSISQVVMRLASDYLTQKALASDSQSIAQRTAHANFADEACEASDFSASTLESSHLHSSFLPSTIDSDFGDAFGAPRRSKISKSLLSERESAVLILIAGGMSSSEIGEELAISVPTVNTHVRNVFAKLGVHTRAQAIHMGISQGMIELS